MLQLPSCPAAITPSAIARFIVARVSVSCACSRVALYWCSPTNCRPRKCYNREHKVKVFRLSTTPDFLQYLTIELYKTE